VSKTDTSRNVLQYIAFWKIKEIMTEIQIPQVTEYINYTEEIGKNMLMMSSEKILQKDCRI
jgi:hypothetical protein